MSQKADNMADKEPSTSFLLFATMAEKSLHHHIISDIVSKLNLLCCWRWLIIAALSILITCTSHSLFLILVAYCPLHIDIGFFFFFLVDVSPPTVVVAPYFTSPRDGKRTDSQWDRSVLQLIWQFADPDSPVVSHTVNVRSQLTGRLLTEPIVVGADDKVRCYADDNTPHL